MPVRPMTAGRETIPLWRSMPFSALPNAWLPGPVGCEKLSRDMATPDMLEIVTLENSGDACERDMLVPKRIWTLYRTVPNGVFVNVRVPHCPGAVEVVPSCNDVKRIGAFVVPAAFNVPF